MVEKKFILYLFLKVNGVKLKLVDGKDLYYYYDKSGGIKIKNPCWKLKKLSMSNGYLITSINVKLYRFNRIVYQAFNPDWYIEDISKNNLIDHIDRNPLNNNINNLRILTQRDNILNTHRSQYAKGYYYNKNKKIYQAYIKLYGKLIHLGCFKTPKEAYLKSKKVRRFVDVLKIIYKNKN